MLIIQPGNALDIGCGNGRNSLDLIKRGWCVTAVDMSEESLTSLRKNLPSENAIKIEISNANFEDFALESDLRR